MSKLSAFVLLCSFLVAFVQANPTGRIVGGSVATDGQFPYQVSVRFLGNHFCGGAIISQNYILTAAHCVGVRDPNGTYHQFEAEFVSIRAGSNSRLDGGVVLDVNSTKVHEQYGNHINDVAVVKLTTPLIFSDHIQAIALASEEVPVGTDMIISGWGRVNTDEDYSLQLKWNTLRSISKLECERVTKLTSDALMCLGHEEFNGACSGDSGGPAACNGELCGVTGFVVGGCGSTNPDGYAKVSYHREWIVNNTDL